MGERKIKEDNKIPSMLVGDKRKLKLRRGMECGGKWGLQSDGAARAPQ